MTDRDIWMPLEEYDGYVVNSYGEVRNVASDRTLRVQTNQNGSQFVSIRDRSAKRYVTVTIGVLVATAFVPGQTASENTVLYLDGDRTNHHASNLMWAARWHAMAYHREIVSAKDVSGKKIKDDLGRVYDDIVAAAKASGALPSAIDYAVRYNDYATQNAKDYPDMDAVRFAHKVWPSGRVYRSV